MKDSNLLIEALALAALPSETTLIVDCRFALSDPGQGERDYLAAHIPGAVYASLDHDLSDLSKPGLGRHPLPDVPVFAAKLARWGWRPWMRVVTYDDAGGALAAARAWWMLRTAGIDATVLDGGWRAWREAGLSVAAGAVARERAPEPALHIDTHAVVYYPELDGLRAQDSILLLDARAASRFRGENETIDRVGGHVPGARNRPFADNLQADGRFKPRAALRAEWAGVLGAHAPNDVIHMCGSGVTACHNVLAMEAVGLAGSRLFAPSWSGWVQDGARPLATGGT